MPRHLPAFNADFYVFFILLGIAQGLLLAYFFLRQKDAANRYFGLALLVLSGLIFDVWMGYSNLMFQAIYLVDFSEPGNFVFAPALFLALKAYLNHKAGRYDALHFVPAVIYFLYAAVALYTLPNEYKYNSNLGAWHPEIEGLNLDYSGMDWRFVLQGCLDELMLVQGTIYVLASAQILIKAFQQSSLSLWSRANARLNWLRNIVAISFIILLTLFFIKINYDDDRGDPIIASFIALAMYLLMGNLLRSTSFFEQLQPEKSRYQRSSLQTQDQIDIAERLKKLMQEEKPYLQSSFSLQSLAKQLKVPSHHLTQTLNENLGLTFFELSAQYRIAEAQLLLQNPATRNLTIEDIAERVGYLSKSAFNAAFKKQTGLTPTVWRDQVASK